MKHLLEAIFLFLLIADSLILSVQGQQCDVVVTSQAALKKTALKNLDVQVDGNISCSQTCDGIERKIDALEAELDGKLNEVLDEKLNDILDKKLYKLMVRLDISFFRIPQHSIAYIVGQLGENF